MKRALALLFTLTFTAHAQDYAILTWGKTLNDPAWKNVVESLREKHNASVHSCDDSLDSLLPALQKQKPRYVAIVGTHDRVPADVVKQIHRLMARIDDDPYTDAQWGIITGRTAKDAAAIVAQSEPLNIRRTVSATRIATECTVETESFDELVAKGHSLKLPNEKEQESPLQQADSIEALANAFSNERTDFIITSGHATTNDWQPGFSYKNGSFHCRDGMIYGKDLTSKEHSVKQGKPKIYLPCGNCLMGAIDGPDAMALAWMGGANVKQLAGYVEPTWYGYMGWGMMDYFVEQPGRFTFSESFLVNHHALVHRLSTTEKLTEMDRRGLAFDRDVVAFYGDPAWTARMADAAQHFQQKLTQTDDSITLEITPLMGEKSYDPVNTNGSQRGGRPFIALLKNRIDPSTMKPTTSLPAHTVLTDDFLLVPRPAAGSAATTIKVEWKKQ